MANNIKLPILVGLVIAGLAACSVFIYYQFRGAMAPDKPDLVAPPPSAPEAPPAEPTDDFEVPALDASDEVVRSLAETLSDHPRLAAWLAPDDLVRKFVAAVVDVANDESPKPHIGHLEPEGDFGIREREGALLIDSGSFDRYDTYAAFFDGLEEEKALELHRRLKPLYDEAYRDLGYPGGDFDVALAKAIDRVLATPIPAGNLVVKRRVSTYRFVDPDLEALGPVEKHLIRMGPVNARKVKEKLRVLRAALPE